jgi:hypothetical protein
VPDLANLLSACASMVTVAARPCPCPCPPAPSDDGLLPQRGVFSVAPGSRGVTHLLLPYSSGGLLATMEDLMALPAELLHGARTLMLPLDLILVSNPFGRCVGAVVGNSSDRDSGSSGSAACVDSNLVVYGQYVAGELVSFVVTLQTVASVPFGREVCHGTPCEHISPDQFQCLLKGETEGLSLGPGVGLGLGLVL